MKNNIDIQKPKAILAVDFDGLLNVFVECPKDKEHKDLPHDYYDEEAFIFINHAKYFEITFKILVDYNVLPVIGSQRIVAEELHFKGMLTALNKVFGENRNYLDETYAREIRQKIKTYENEELLNAAKNALLHEYAAYGFDKKKITLVDDAIDYKAATEAEDFQFIHIDRKN